MSSAASTAQRQSANSWKSANPVIIAGSGIRASPVQGSFFWSKYKEYYQSILTTRITVSEGCRRLLLRRALMSASEQYTVLWAKPGLSTGTADLTASQRLILKLRTERIWSKETSVQTNHWRNCWRISPRFNALTGNYMFRLSSTASTARSSLLKCVTTWRKNSA